MPKYQFIFTILIAVTTFICQKTLSNIIAGSLLRASRPFSKNDHITAMQGSAQIGSGRVMKIGLFNVVLKTYEKQIITIPNAKVLDDCIIINNTKNPKFNQIQKIEVSLDSNIDDAKKLISDILIVNNLTYNTAENTVITLKLLKNSLELTYNVKTRDLDDSYKACNVVLEEIIKKIQASETVWMQ